MTATASTCACVCENKVQVHKYVKKKQYSTCTCACAVYLHGRLCTPNLSFPDTCRDNMVCRDIIMQHNSD